MLEKADIVFLSVKPYCMDGVLDNIRSKVTKNHLMVSIAAGYSLGAMAEHLPLETRMVTVMPNTPSLVGAGAAGYCLGEHALPEDAETINKLMSAVGIANLVSEKQMDAVCGLSGSGPAYVYQLIEALADGGVKMGLQRPIA